VLDAEEEPGLPIRGGYSVNLPPRAILLVDERLEHRGFHPREEVGLRPHLHEEQVLLHVEGLDRHPFAVDWPTRKSIKLDEVVGDQVVERLPRGHPGHVYSA